MADSPFTPGELEFLSGTRLGRLATVGPDEQPQNNPVGFRWNPETGTVDIGGRSMGTTRKFRNAREHPRVSFVVDDLASTDPWTVRGIEIRGEAEALTGVATGPGYSDEIIRIHPRRVLAWGIDPGTPRMNARDVGGA